MNKSHSCICINLRQASLAITRFYDAVLEPSGLKVTQYSALIAIRQLEPVSISGLAENLGLDRTTLGRNLRVLERENLITFSPGQDQREHTVHLTSQARLALEVAYPLWEQAQAKIRQNLGQPQVEMLKTLLADLEATIA
ncbi:MAG: HpaR: homoprotocatechuate degradation operon regulator, HpaR [Chloroflexi bacterium]|jgi:DNA-binding MarR family transcriptional regulator|nr:HpaR: homoprotocatechuate degradation operon regulator, HpaR [Chloroflexota bacterium]